MGTSIWARSPKTQVNPWSSVDRQTHIRYPYSKETPICHNLPIYLCSNSPGFFVRAWDRIGSRLRMTPSSKPGQGDGLGSCPPTIDLGVARIVAVLVPDPEVLQPLGVSWMDLIQFLLKTEKIWKFCSNKWIQMAQNMAISAVLVTKSTQGPGELHVPTADGRRGFCSWWIPFCLLLQYLQWWFFVDGCFGSWKETSKTARPGWEKFSGPTSVGLVSKSTSHAQNLVGRCTVQHTLFIQFWGEINKSNDLITYFVALGKRWDNYRSICWDHYQSWLLVLKLWISTEHTNDPDIDTGGDFREEHLSGHHQGSYQRDAGPFPKKKDAKISQVTTSFWALSFAMISQK